LLRVTRDEAARGLVDFGRLEEMLGRVHGRIDHRRPGRVTPFAAPLLLERGRVPVEGRGRAAGTCHAGRAADVGGRARRAVSGGRMGAAVRGAGARRGLAWRGGLGQERLMNVCHDCRLAGVDLRPLPSGALFVPGAGRLAVADLHLGRSERAARRQGRMLPPYETAATLDRLGADLAATGAGGVVALGDSFDGFEAAAALGPAERARLARLMAGRRWIWVEGNHDPGAGGHGGKTVAAIALAGLTFRHIARDGAGPGEVSGHWHPKFALPGHRPRAAFLLDARRLILPAYGAYTGGPGAQRPALRALLGARALAVLTGARAIAAPLPAAAARARA
jgi:DNA ligase-associated metallophosphoesterase